jgi:putative holliday junction resolvase
MARIVAIDYGTKRTGLAVTDESETFAFGLDTVTTHDLERYLKNYAQTNSISGFVVGEPRDMQNQPTHATSHIEGFIKRLLKIFPGIPVYRMDERFTSKMASRSILESGIKKMARRDKALVDMVSATIILQSWLEQKSLQNRT